MQPPSTKPTAPRPNHSWQSAASVPTKPNKRTDHSLVDPLLPPAITDTAQREVARLVTWTTLVSLTSLLAWNVALLLGISSSSSPMWMPLLNSVLLLIPTIILWTRHAPTLAAHSLMAVGFLVTVLPSALGDGLLAAEAKLIPAVPLLALVLLKRRPAVLWILLTAPAFALLYWVSLSQPELANAQMDPTATLMHYFQQITVNGGLAILAMTRWENALTLAEEARESAERSAEARQRTLAVTSHELRTPLNGILASLELLQPKLRTADALELHALAVRSGETLRSLIEDILVHSRLQAGKLEPELVSFHLRPLLHDLKRLFQPEANRKNITLSISTEPNINAVWRGDPRRLSQVLTNLLGNALKFTMEGEVKLHVQRTEEGVEFTVTDSGPGISQDLLGQLFQPFSQADVSTSRRHGGSGLGLAITQQLIHAMSGSLQVHSTAGEGSSFVVQLPLQPDTTHNDLQDEPTNARLSLKPKPAQVLIVEDNPVNRRVLELMLTELGSEVGSATSGESGAQAAISEQWDLILMDCRMPDVDGFEATRRIREAGVIVPIVAVTASATPFERAQCIDSGMDGVLEKPVKQEDLRALLVRWVGLG